MKERLVKCEQRRHDCVMCNHQGKCVALSDTTFKNGRRTYKCPFYKPRKNYIAKEVEYDETESD